MALCQITFEDKVDLSTNPNIANKNKVIADDMNQIKNAINNLFPIGFIVSVNSATFDPNVIYGGTWERLKGKMIIGVDEDDTDFATGGLTGGEKKHTLTVDEMPSHTHEMIYGYGSGSETTYNASVTGKQKSITGATYTTENVRTGGDQPHNNMPPYITAYMWIKTAM